MYYTVSFHRSSQSRALRGQTESAMSLALRQRTLGDDDRQEETRLSTVYAEAASILEKMG